jgi:mannose-6-phosphate isomerase
MFVAIANTPRDYAWGSATAIPELLGTPVTGKPQAELWLGTHPGSPAQIVGDGSLADLVQLPFLLKVLAADKPLSLQAHPSIAQAIEGFARENALGIPLDAPNRNYKDELHKPELLFALTPFRALCGFRPATETRAALERLLGAEPGDPALTGFLDRLGSDDEIRPTFEWLISRGPGVHELLEQLEATAARVEGEHYTLIGELASVYPGDPGIAISLMLNLAVLSRGQVLYLPAGNIHAYIEGVGIELMAASDNVLRGGLTPKHVDVQELLRVLDFTPGPVPYLAPKSLAPGAEVFQPVPEFGLIHLTSSSRLPLGADAIVFCTSGSFSLAGRSGSASVDRGGAMYVSAEERSLVVTGDGELFVATAGS